MVRKLFNAIYSEGLEESKPVIIKIPFLKKKGNYFEVIEHDHQIEVNNGKVKLKVPHGTREFASVEILAANKQRLTIYNKYAEDITIMGMNDGFVVTGHFWPKRGDKIRIGSFINFPAEDIDKSLNGDYELTL